MVQNEIQERIDELKRQIDSLPSGTVSTKKIKGKVYYYHRVSIDGKRKEIYVPQDEAEELISKINTRKELEKELKKLKPPAYRVHTTSADYITNIRTGSALRNITHGVLKYKRRECFRTLSDFIYNDDSEKVFILYGLRRTGKTTLIRQVISSMSDEEFSKAAFIQITPGNTLADVNKDLKRLEANGFRYIFIDEVTLMSDFIVGAALFSDVFATCGMKIVLSGTDSLGFMFTEDEQLYDRCIMLHTTFIPYREFESVLGIKGIDEYIRYGGTMSMSGAHYNEDSTFTSKKKTDEYLNTAIAYNIQHSLKYYQNEGHFRNLYSLYQKNELTRAINRVVEDMNHKFTVQVLTRDFVSHDIGQSARNLRNHRVSPNDILDRIDLQEVTRKLRNLLEIRNRNEQSIEIEDIHCREIKEYLDMLDLTIDIDVRSIPDIGHIDKHTTISQPGMRYCQVDALITSLMQDRELSDLSLEEQRYVTERIRNEVMGRMMEDIVLLETKMAFPKKQVFKLKFAVGEFDMVVAAPDSCTCCIYEIKHSVEAVPVQYRHLIDAEKCASTEFSFGRITGRYVIYRGDNFTENGVEYINVEEYLKSL